MGLKAEYVGFHCTDGASNAVKSMEVYQMLTEINRSTPIAYEKCHAHQCNRSCKYAAGTGEFVENKNVDLWAVLTKCHRILARVLRSSNRMKILKDVQVRKERTRIRMPDPGVVTRWNSEHNEVAKLNIFMGDFNQALGIMLADDGIDAALLTGPDGPVDRKENMFTPNDKKILRQYECGAEPCVQLSKFFQINGPTSHEVLFNLRARIEQLRSPSFSCFSDISHSNLKDLSKRMKTETVIASYIQDPTDTSDDESQRTEVMDICIEKFRDLFAADMEKRCGIDGKSRLPADIAVACLMNPLYGGKLLPVFCVQSNQF
jgi:hypothetical protein